MIINGKHYHWAEVGITQEHYVLLEDGKEEQDPLAWVGPLAVNPGQTVAAIWDTVESKYELLGIYTSPDLAKAEIFKKVGAILSREEWELIYLDVTHPLDMQ